MSTATETPKATVKVHWRATFYLVLPKPTAKLLRELAQRHYDYKCKAAGFNGFLNRWEVDGEAGLPSVCTFDELDTALKVCEMAEVVHANNPKCMELITNFRQAASAAARAANLRYLQLHEEG